MLRVEGAQPIRPYAPPISIVWTEGEPADPATCALLAAALAGGDAEAVEYGYWGRYNVILRVGRSEQNARYFLADVLQFQFHRGLCKAAGYSGPLHRCSIYNNKVAGARLKKMLEMGKSQPWPDALFALTGERQMDSSAIADYFAPLKKWLDEQNAKNDVKVGW